jgi:hypothetical protein
MVAEAATIKADPAPPGPRDSHGDVAARVPRAVESEVPVA